MSNTKWTQKTVFIYNTNVCMCMYMPSLFSVFIYTHVYMLSSFTVFVYTYVCMCTYMYVYMNACTYAYTEYI